ncbi:MAG: acetate--CoA ligase family protein [Alphaproteobacteria bacterium]|nr:acetate--CoA ligase family protein [Alphaproteobacteria bacterium]
MGDLSRLFRPRSVAVLGGWWAENVIEQCQKSGFDGDIWPVHPKRDEIRGIPCYRSLADLPGPPDAAFLGINRHAVIEVAAELSAMGCGGAVCFASGFAEAGEEDLQNALVAAAGEMPLLGPNCYGVLNYLDGAMLWPDQHGGRAVDSGVAIISQSSNIAINLSMQARGLPMAYVACVGNQAQTSLSDMARSLLADPRVTAAGLYIEGIVDSVDFAAMASEAMAAGKHIVAIKAGRTAAAQAAASSHTAALAGDGATSSAFLARCGVIEVESPEDLMETLKILHLHGRLAGRRITAMCCSGGEAGLTADLAGDLPLDWPSIPDDNLGRLGGTLGPLVALANPLDYHTFIWGDEAKMTETFAAMMGDWVDISVLAIDFPRDDRCSDEAWHPAVAAMKAAGRKTGTKTAMLGTLAEGVSESWADRLTEAGIVPLCGFEHGLRAIAHAGVTAPTGDWRPYAALPAPAARRMLDETASKALLGKAGVSVPRGVTADAAGDLADAAAGLATPLVLKGLGHAHKSEAGLVRLGLSPDELADAAKGMTLGTNGGTNGAQGFLVEEMAPPPVGELLVGLRRDPVYGISLTVGSGGVTAELLGDVATLVLPIGRDEIRAAINGLRLAPLLNGYRGRAPADIEAAVDTIAAMVAIIEADPAIDEIEVNPLMLGEPGTGALAVDAVIWKTDPQDMSPDDRNPGRETDT